MCVQHCGGYEYFWEGLEYSGDFLVTVGDVQYYRHPLPWYLTHVLQGEGISRKYSRLFHEGASVNQPYEMSVVNVQTVEGYHDCSWLVLQKPVQ